MILFLLGVLTSFIASVMFYAFTYLRSKSVQRKRFARAAGSYKAYSFDENGDLYENGSNAIIRYEGENILSVELTESNGYQWVGKMPLELESYGTVVWGHTNLPHPKHRFGFKRCIVNADGVYVYLFGERERSIGAEIMNSTFKLAATQFQLRNSKRNRLRELLNIAQIQSV